MNEKISRVDAGICSLASRHFEDDGYCSEAEARRSGDKKVSDLTKKTDSKVYYSDEWWKNYIRSRMRKDDVPDTNVGKTEFKPGNKFILELGAERRMFHEFEIAGTDLYVKVDLLEKLPRYEPDDQISRKAAIEAAHKNYDSILDFRSDGETVAQSFEDILTALPSVGSEIVHCKDCTHGKSDVFDRGMWCELHPSFDITENDYCSRAERRNDG